GIGYSGVLRVFAGHYDEIIVPGILALIAAIVSVAVTEGLYWYTRTKAKKINSGALMADAWHHRFAVVPSVIALIGIAGAMLGVRILEPIASVIICLFILKSALSIFLGAIAKLTDRAADDATVEELRGLITEQEGVLSIDTLRTRMFDHELYIDAEIGVNGDLNLRAGHRIARTVREAVEAEIPKVRRCAVHVIPAEKAGEEQAEEMPK
ncbi:MAG: cation diffusion facilitator family transporter, partial [Firmicutes bacterium]|nr:cation diffusion facilitator family transporter [Bacillota bacterium]